MEAVDDIPPAPRQGDGKVGCNEGRKLAATFSNNVGVAFFLAAFLQPALAFVQQYRALDLVIVMASTTVFVVAAAGFVGSQVIVRRLED